MKLIFLIILALAGAGCYLYSMYRGQKAKSGSSRKNVQEFMNVVDIENSFIYTKDNYLIGFLQISGRKTDLLSGREKAEIGRAHV